MKLWLVRHARPLVAPGVCYGALDVPADDAATRSCAAQLASTLPIQDSGPVSMSSSPLQRCELLTHYLCGLRPDLIPIFDPDLAEMDFGSWEGRRWDAIGEAAVARWTGQFATHRPGGGESVQEFMLRIEAALSRLQGDKAVWITHAGVIRAATLIAGGMRMLASADQWPVDGPDYGETVLLEM
jgi:alpha-ribazole phosphatase